VHRDGRQHRALGRGQVGGPARGRDVGADLDQPVHPDRGGGGDVLGRLASDNVQVRVAVQHGDG
jgi:hypothetical protein